MATAPDTAPLHIRFEALVEHISDMVVMLDAVGVIIYMSPSVRAIGGYEPAELLGKPFYDYAHPDDLRGAAAMLTGLLQQPAEVRRDSLRYRHRDGSWVILETASVNHLQDPEIRGIVITARDITELAEMRVERARHATLIRRGLEETIQAVTATLDARDSYTAGHERRVAHLASAIGAKLGMNEDALTGLYLAASVHDIGKIQVPMEILTKPRRLLAPEYALIQTHVQAGHDILKDVHFPWPIAEIVHQHHEQPDGSGYPRGLSRSEILPEALIVAVADTVESMALRRNYRAALGAEEALDEITRRRGSSYDPAAVDACVSLFREDGYQLSA
ncbi:MAG TPA: HD domain-containing phosphohydrolase [Solimonas sp.]|nr:HD domain-containing phosphohydrolase [Solimonas sp.]